MKAKADIKDIQIVTGGFQFKGSTRPFADIAHLRFVRTKTTTYVGLPVETTKIGAEESVGLMISLISGEEIYLSEKPGWILSSKEEKIQGIITLYTALSQATFASRLASYIKDAEKCGYFVYSRHRFYPSRQVISSDSQEFTRENTDFRRAYGYIELRPNKPSLAHTIKQKIGASKPITIDTLTDTDVIFTILANYYGLRWN